MGAQRRGLIWGRGGRDTKGKEAGAAGQSKASVVGRWGAWKGGGARLGGCRRLYRLYEAHRPGHCQQQASGSLQSQMRLATSKRVRTGGPRAGAPAAVRWGTRCTSGTYIQGENGSFCEFIGEGARSPPPSVRCCVYRAVRCHSSTERRSIDPLAPTEHHRPFLGRKSTYLTPFGKCRFLGRKSTYHGYSFKPGGVKAARATQGRGGAWRAGRRSTGVGQTGGRRTGKSAEVGRP